MTWAYFGIAVAGTALNVLKHPAGFALWIVSNVLWGWHCWSAGETALTMQFAAFGLLAVWGFVSWTRKAPEQKAAKREQKRPSPERAALKREQMRPHRHWQPWERN